MLEFDSVPQPMLWNRELALERVGGDLDLLREVAGIFLLDCPRAMGEIRDAISQGDAKRLEREAHSLKGAAASFGADPVVGVALALEMIGRRGQLAEAPAKFAELEEGLRQLEPELFLLSSSSI